MPFKNCPFDVTPLDQSNLTTLPNVSSLNYTNQDFWSLKNRLLQYVKEQFTTDFNDFVEGDLAIMLIENFAFVGDLLSFKLDQIANEIFIDTVTEVDNAFRLSKLVGFQPLPPIAASSMWTASINTALTQDVVIPSGTPVTTATPSGSINIELFASDINGNPLFGQDILIPAGSLSNSSIVGLEGTTITDTFYASGAVGQTYQSSVYPVIYSSVQVSVDGVTWTQVDSFTDSNPRREYRVEFDSNWNSYVIFGNNQAGLIPSLNSTVEITYRQGGGTIGNIVTGSVNTQFNFIVPGINYSVPVSFTNYTRGQNGYNGDTIDDIRAKLPVYLNLQNRCVSGADYKNYADQFATPYQGQVGKSTAVLRNYGCAANIIDLYILALDGSGSLTEASDELKVQLSQQMDTVKMLTDYVCIRDGTILQTDVQIDVILDKFYRKFQDDINAKITNLMTQFFSIANWDYGQSLKATDIIRALSPINQATDFVITLTTTDPNNSGSLVSAKFYEVIVLDNLTVQFTYQ